MKVANRAIHGFLRQLELRSTLSAEERRLILGLDGVTVQVQARRDLVSPGALVRYVCLVADGLVGRFDQMADGSRQTTSLYIPGDICDLQSVVLPVASWGITALAPSTVMQIPHTALHEAARRNPAIAMAFWQLTGVDMAIVSKWVGNIGRKDARARVAHLFCEMGPRMEEAGLGRRTRYRFAMTQEQIGDVMGLTPVHVNRVLKVLREEKAVTFRSETVDIHDLPLLQSIADFDPTFLLLDRETKAGT